MNKVILIKTNQFNMANKGSSHNNNYVRHAENSIKLFLLEDRNSLITLRKYGLVFNVKQSTIFNILHIKYFVF